MDLGSIHGNSERPGYYQAWIAAAETSLPLKGTWHRRANGDDKEPKPVSVCSFTNSDLWKMQGFPIDGLPKAVAEPDFIVPSQKSFLTSNDARRNLTDTQETAQWVTGAEFYQKLFQSLWGILIDDVTIIFYFTI